MKKFIIKTSFFIITIFALFLYILSRANGYTDPYYIRFTTPKQNNLIIGTSRSSQGLQPKIFDKILKKKFFNYSFTIAHSPFGSVYFNSIKKKLNHSVKDGIFIVTVDPWSISNQGENPNEIKNFGENNLALSNTNFVDMNPNFEYLIKNLNGEYYKILTNTKGEMFLHNDGWLEVTLPMDSISLTNRSKDKITDYRNNNLPFRKLSTIRLKYLSQIVQYLKKYGKVYLVRLPVSSEMFKIEVDLMHNFNQIIRSIIKKSNGYLDMSNDGYPYEFIDGNHLWKESGKIVSKKIAFWIKTNS